MATAATARGGLASSGAGSCTSAPVGGDFLGAGAVLVDPGCGYGVDLVGHGDVDLVGEVEDILELVAQGHAGDPGPDLGRQLPLPKGGNRFYLTALKWWLAGAEELGDGLGQGRGTVGEEEVAGPLEIFAFLAAKKLDDFGLDVLVDQLGGGGELALLKLQEVLDLGLDVLGQVVRQNDSFRCATRFRSRNARRSTWRSMKSSAPL